MPGRSAPVSWAAVGSRLMFEPCVVALVAEHNPAVEAGDRTPGIGGAAGGGVQDGME